MTNTKAKDQFLQLKSDCNRFRQLFIAAQVRNTRLDDLFPYENRPLPPALSLRGNLRQTSTKHAPLHCIEPHFQ